VSVRLDSDFYTNFFWELTINSFMTSYFYISQKLVGKILFYFKSIIANIFLYTCRRKFDTRSCEDRREFSYTEYIPERRSGKDRRKGIIMK
jgi:hypothetical protein